MDAVDGFMLGSFVTLILSLTIWFAYNLWKSNKENEEKRMADEIFKRCYKTFELKKKEG
jgi:predicted negative regulator of RcsB-dependent stress response